MEEERVLWFISVLEGDWDFLVGVWEGVAGIWMVGFSEGDFLSYLGRRVVGLGGKG